MFEREDPGFGEGAEPSGYIRIEIREGKGSILLQLQNLISRNDTAYKAYMLRCADKRVLPVILGKIETKKSRGELSLEFDPENFLSSGYRIDEFNMAVILAEHTDRENNKAVCPLAAYRDGKQAWREQLEEMLYKKTPCISDEAVLIKQDSFDRYKQEIEENLSPDLIEQTNIAEEPDSPDGEAAGSCEGQPFPGAGSAHESTVEDGYGGEMPGGAFRGYKSGSAGNSGPWMYAGGRIPCTICQHNDKKPVNKPDLPKEIKPAQPQDSIEMLKKSLDECFESFDPFRSKRRDYRWWKVGNPVQFHNILYQCSIKIPLLFNPKVMMAHFKYRHMIVGIYTDRLRKKEYMVCGIPGAYNLDDRPFGEMCRWVQVEGSRPRYGAFGYWLAYIDSSTGNMLALS